jgi:hypothetical protein
VRVDMLRTATYELLITRHAPGKSNNGSRPQLETAILFRGIPDRIELELCGKDKSRAGNIVPTFYPLAGETIPPARNIWAWRVRRCEERPAFIAFTHAT